MALGLMGAIGGTFAETPLYWALTNNDVVEVWNLTATAPPPAVLDENASAPAAWAVARGNTEALSALLWRGVALNEVDARGRNLLFEAAALGRVDLFETIVAAGARWDQVDHEGLTLIHMAVGSPHPEMLQTLLSLGLGAKTRTASGVTPLMLACLSGQADQVKILLAWGAVAEDQDYLGRHVRDYAVTGGSLKVLSLIDEALIPWTIEPAGGAPPP
jgi:ankyrin repeat protein